MHVVCSTVSQIRLFCPLTGQDALVENNPSPATIFIYHNEVGFIYLSPQYQRKVDAWIEADEELMHNELLEKLVGLNSEEEESCVCFSINETGPAQENICVGFDMAVS